MEIADYLKRDALRALSDTDRETLPIRLSGTHFYVAESSDATVIAHASVSFQSKEYKIGPRLEKTGSNSAKRRGGSQPSTR